MCLRCAISAMHLLANGLAAAAAAPGTTPDQRALLDNMEHALRSFQEHSTNDEDADTSSDKLLADFSVLTSQELRDVGVAFHFMGFATKALSETILATLHMRAAQGDEAAKAIIAKDTREETEVQVHVIDLDALRREREAQAPQVPGRGKQPPMMS